MAPQAYSGRNTESPRFAADERGNVAMLFGLTLVPMVFFAGAAIDYSGASDLKAKLQRATDGANLQLCLMSVTSTQAQLDDAAQKGMAGYMGGRPFRVDAVVPTTKPRTITLETSADYPTAVVRAVNASMTKIPLKAVARCSSEQQTFEIALVLDTTGSMNYSSGGQSKMQALRTAATNFVTSVFTDPLMKDNTKVSLVPFAASVAVDPAAYKNASWIDDKGRATHHWSFIQGGATTAAAYASYGVKSRFDVFTQLKASVPSWDWNGCFESLPYPLNTQDGAPTPSNKDSYYVPMFAPDESGNGGEFQHPSGSTTVVSMNSYIDDSSPVCPASTDEATRTGQACKYVQIMNAKTSNGYRTTGPNVSCTSRPLTRMTTSQTTLKNEIAALSASGNTNIHEGLMWGWRTISPSSVFADGASYTKEFNNKVIVLMTDGMNTWNANAYNPTLKSTYSAYGFFKNPDGTSANTRIPTGNANPTTDAQSRAAIDAMTLQSCQNARAAGVVIFTVGFSVPGDAIDQQGLDLLRDCAGNSTRFFVASDAAAINDVFQQIAQSIGRLRLSM